MGSIKKNLKEENDYLNLNKCCVNDLINRKRREEKDIYHENLENQGSYLLNYIETLPCPDSSSFLLRYICIHKQTPTFHFIIRSIPKLNK